ncbi:MAG: GNAT family N-acetyltransferase [Candidatus Dormibacteria bacterium]
MAGESSSAGRLFQPASEPVAVDQVRSFLLAQGWAGLAAGEHLRRLEAAGEAPNRVLWWVPGRAGEVRAAALLHEGLLGILISSGEEGSAALELLRVNRASIDRISVMDGPVPYSGLDEFTQYRRELAVATRLRFPTGDLPPTRLARSSDGEQLFRVYQHVSWMSKESPQAWRERIQVQRSWVAELEGQVVAAARWTMSFGQWVEVGGVATHPDFRHRQAGSAVTRAAAAAALAEGRQVVLRYGDPALASLYHPLGFEHVGREMVFYRKSRAEPDV